MTRDAMRATHLTLVKLKRKQKEKKREKREKIEEKERREEEERRGGEKRGSTFSLRFTEIG